MMKTPHLPLLALGSLTTALSGCAGLGAITGDDKLAVRSTPSQATVFVMEKPVGKTPMELSQQTIYPSAYPQDKQHLYGQITLRKTGCEDYTTRVSSSAIARGLDITLDCGGDVSPEAAATPAPTAATSSPQDTGGAVVAQPKTTPPAKPLDLSAKQRLQRIDALKQEGLINDSEYREIRQRILDAL